MKEKILPERESSILTAIVHDYIITGKPVGSRSFVQKYSLSISPATTRNIMYDLEILGYLMQPHTSAGRIPTDMGYRFYVNSLLVSYDFMRKQDATVREDALKKEIQLEKVYSSITKMLSTVSKYSGVMLAPRPDFTVIKRIELLPLDNNEVLVVMVTRTGMVVNKKVVISATVTQDGLHDYSKYLTSELCGYPIFEIRHSVIDRLRSGKPAASIRDLALDIIQLALTGSDEPELYIDGIENLLRIPEMVEEKRLSSLLNIIEEKNILKEILEKTIDTEGVLTLIGDEVENEKVSGCSMVTSSYKIGNKNVGVIGVIGPTRMDYEKVVPLVDYTCNVVSDYFTKMSK
ncbi:MAG: heat-inducible transcriptional repressor HrcA [Spirochaetes bacterium]|jgi:heat-inducible transcriptional repressor|nr:heat-inducible transcriptional repressor HrcA [Spirochaetota bacterium]